MGGFELDPSEPQDQEQERGSGLRKKNLGKVIGSGGYKGPGRKGQG